MSKITDYISNTMSLREPLKQSLELLDSLIATEINKARKEKAWKYAIIPHDKTDTNMTFKKLVTEFGK